MNRFGRALVLSGCLALASGVLMAGATCPPVTLSLGSAATSGTVQFTMSGSNGSLFTVQVSVAAGDTPAVVAARIAYAVNNSSWQAHVNPDSSLTFTHYEGGVWNNVTSINGLQNTASISMRLSTYQIKSYAEISINAMASAAGHGSTMTFSVPGESVPLNLGLFQGQSASSIMDAIAAYLNSAGPGVTYVRLSPTKIGINFSYVNSWVTFQTNDTGLQGKWTESDKVSDCGSQSGLIQN